MSLIAKPGAGDFTPAPVGMHSAICVWCIDLGEQEDDFGKGENGEGDA